MLDLLGSRHRSWRDRPHVVDACSQDHLGKKEHTWLMPGKTAVTFCAPGSTTFVGVETPPSDIIPSSPWQLLPQP